MRSIAQIAGTAAFADFKRFIGSLANKVWSWTGPRARRSLELAAARVLMPAGAAARASAALAQGVRMRWEPLGLFAALAAPHCTAAAVDTHARARWLHGRLLQAAELGSAPLCLATRPQLTPVPAPGLHPRQVHMTSCCLPPAPSPRVFAKRISQSNLQGANHPKHNKGKRTQKPAARRRARAAHSLYTRAAAAPAYCWPGHRQVRGMERPCTSIALGTAQVPMLVAQLEPPGLPRWSASAASGPLPVAWACGYVKCVGGGQGLAHVEVGGWAEQQLPTC